MNKENRVYRIDVKTYNLGAQPIVCKRQKAKKQSEEALRSVIINITPIAFIGWSMVCAGLAMAIITLLSL